MDKKKKNCWIFGGAPNNDYKISPPNDTYIIAADSGYSILKALGIKPNLVLGDFDSYTSELPKDCEIIKAVPEKDDTDTMLAVKIALSRGYKDIVIAASIGGRLDHTFANIQTLAYILENGGYGYLLGENDIVHLLNVGEYTFEKINGMYFSIFSYSEKATVTTCGTKYNLSEYCLTNKFPLGVSNEIISDKCCINVKNGQILVIFSKM